MPSTFARCLALLMLTAAVGAPAQEVPQLLRPGAWDVRSGRTGEAMVGYQLCLRSGGMEDVKLLLPRLQGAASCPQDRLSRDGQTLTWELSCPAIPLSASARYTLQAEAVDGQLDVSSGAPPVRQSEVISARYAGPCPAR